MPRWRAWSCEDFKALYEDAGFGSIRYPGGTISNLFNWKTTIGPVVFDMGGVSGKYIRIGIIKGGDVDSNKTGLEEINTRLAALMQ